MKSTSNSMEQKCTLVETRGSVKGCSGGSNELLDLKIKILYIKKKNLSSLLKKKKKKIEHPNLNFAHPNHK